MIVAGLLVGLATGGSPWFAREIATASLVLAMTLALTEIRFSGLSPRQESRAFAHAFLWNYVVLSGLVLVIAYATADSDFRAGWVMMAAVPSAIAVVPLTSVLRGNVRSALISTALLYIASLALVPAITLVFVGRAVPPAAVAFNTALQIGLPLAVSRALVRAPKVERWRPTAVNLSFFAFVTVIVGANRGVLTDLSLVASLTAASLIRTFGIGLAIVGLARIFRRGADETVAWTLFGSFKNLGLTALLAFSLFNERAAVPGLVALFFEIVWLVALQRVLRLRAS